MKTWTKDELITAGYHIVNAYIEAADLDMEDHGCLVLRMPMQLECGGVCYGGIALGHGYLGAKEFSSNGSGLVYIMHIMDTIGVARFQSLKGKHCRVAVKSWGDTVKIIGNIIEDKWFDPASFFQEYEEDKKS